MHPPCPRGTRVRILELQVILRKVTAEGENNESHALTDVCRFICRVIPTHGGDGGEFSYSCGRSSTEIIGYDDVYYSGILYRWRNIAHTLLLCNTTVKKRREGKNPRASERFRFRRRRIIASLQCANGRPCVCALIPMWTISTPESNTWNKVHFCHERHAVSLAPLLRHIPPCIVASRVPLWHTVRGLLIANRGSRSPLNILEDVCLLLRFFEESVWIIVNSVAETSGVYRNVNAEDVKIVLREVRLIQSVCFIFNSMCVECAIA